MKWLTNSRGSRIQNKMASELAKILTGSVNMMIDSDKINILRESLPPLCFKRKRDADPEKIADHMKKMSRIICIPFDRDSWFHLFYRGDISQLVQKFPRSPLENRMALYLKFQEDRIVYLDWLHDNRTRDYCPSEPTDLVEVRRYERMIRDYKSVLGICALICHTNYRTIFRAAWNRRKELDDGAREMVEWNVHLCKQNKKHPFVREWRGKDLENWVEKIARERLDPTKIRVTVPDINDNVPGLSNPDLILEHLRTHEKLAVECKLGNGKSFRYGQKQSHYEQYGAVMLLCGKSYEGMMEVSRPFYVLDDLAILMKYQERE